MWNKLFVASCLITVASAQWWTKYEVKAAGRVTCDGKPVVNATVVLWEQDTLDDDRLQTRFTDQNGRYEVYGYDTEWTKITPYLVVKHSCNGKEQEVKHYIPKTYVFVEGSLITPYQKDFNFNRTVTAPQN
uniref:Transthyretin-like family protein n=1 Tax=Bursaphelenchus xylophilus TaxID=6326 RepID=A0A1I7RQH2_BURXY